MDFFLRTISGSLLRIGAREGGVVSFVPFLAFFVSRLLMFFRPMIEPPLAIVQRFIVAGFNSVCKGRAHYSEGVFSSQRSQNSRVPEQG